MKSRTNPSLESFYKSLHRTRFSIKEDSSIASLAEKYLDEYIALPEYQDLMNNHNWTKGDVYAEIVSIIKQKNQEAISAHFEYLKAIGTDRPSNPIWDKYTYEEIIQMSENGANVPDDILKWAKAMANEDETTYELTSEEDSEEDLMSDFKSDMDNANGIKEKQLVVKYTQSANNQIKEIEKKSNEVESTKDQLEQKEDALENEQNSTVGKVEKFSKELYELKNKADNGEALTPQEELKYRALTGKINEENMNLQLNSERIQEEVTGLFETLNNDSSEIELNNNIAQNLKFESEAFSKEEGRLNEGSLRKQSPMAGIFSGEYKNSAKGRYLSNNLFDISNDMLIQANLWLNNIFEANNVRFAIDFKIKNAMPETDDTNSLLIQENNEQNSQTEDSELNENSETGEVITLSDANNGIESIGAESADIDENLNTDTDSAVSDKSSGRTLAAQVTGAYSQIQKSTYSDDKSTGDLNKPQASDDNESSIDNDLNITPQEEDKNLTMDDGKAVEEQGSRAEVTAKTAQSRQQEAQDELAKTLADSKKHVANLHKKQNQISSIVKKNNALNSNIQTLNKEKASVMENLQSVSYNEATDTEQSAQNKSELIENLAALNAQTETYSESVEKNEKGITSVENSGDKDSENVVNEAEKADSELEKESEEVSKNADAHKTLSENIIDIAEKFIKVKKLGAMLMLSPWTESAGITLNNIGQYGERVSFFANEVVLLAHGNLIDTFAALKEFKSGQWVKRVDSNKASSAMDKDASKGLAESKNLKTELGDDKESLNYLNDTGSSSDAAGETASHIINTEDSETSTLQDSSLSYSAGDETQVSDKTSSPKSSVFANANNKALPDTEQTERLDASKKESPQNESFSVQQVITTVMAVTDEDIERETSLYSDSTENETTVEDSVDEQIVRETPLYLQSSGIVSQAPIQAEEYSVDIKEDEKAAILTEAVKDSIRNEVRASVLELMQALLSSTNKDEQKKDSDTDKRHKLFTQFERQKKDALRKTVQGANKARDAR